MFRLKEITPLSGRKCKIYSPVIGKKGEGKSLFEVFVEENFIAFRTEAEEILTRLEYIGRNGALEIYFKQNEGRPGDGVCALFDEGRKFRRYCIRLGTGVIILGGGAEKNVGAWQDDVKLSKHAREMIDLSAEITTMIKEKSDALRWEKGKLTGDRIIQ